MQPSRLQLTGKLRGRSTHSVSALKPGDHSPQGLLLAVRLLPAFSFLHELHELLCLYHVVKADRGRVNTRKMR